jgi:hypothetical protein
MDLIEPIWSQDKPTESDVEIMWRELEISQQPFRHPVVDELLQHLRDMHPNGGALFAQFHISDHPTFHWFASRNRFWEMNFFQHFLSSRPVTAAMQELQIDEANFPNPGFEWGNSFTLDGEIGQLLFEGGPYGRFNGTPREAKNLGRRFCDALFADRFMEIQVQVCHKRWAPWFHGIAWDSRWVGLDKRFSNVWILCTTDID